MYVYTNKTVGPSDIYKGGKQCMESSNRATSKSFAWSLTRYLVRHSTPSILILGEWKDTSDVLASRISVSNPRSSFVKCIDSRRCEEVTVTRTVYSSYEACSNQDSACTDGSGRDV